MRDHAGLSPFISQIVVIALSVEYLFTHMMSMPEHYKYDAGERVRNLMDSVVWDQV